MQTLGDLANIIKQEKFRYLAYRHEGRDIRAEVMSYYLEPTNGGHLLRVRGITAIDLTTLRAQNFEGNFLITSTSKHVIAGNSVQFEAHLSTGKQEVIKMVLSYQYL